MKIRLPIKRGRGGSQNQGRKELYLDSLHDFAEDLVEIQKTLDFHMSARGWCYVLEPMGLDKGDFDWGAKQIQEARLQGFLQPGFILEEPGHEVEEAYDVDWEPERWVDDEYEQYQEAEEKFRDSWMDYNAVSFWKDKDYYLQVLVEKIDLKSLFAKVCEQYHIQIANMRGWGSMEQKAIMAKAFEKMEEKEKTPVLLMCGDFDPPGLSISEVKSQFENYKLFTGWDPENLIVDRIGLNYKFIQENDLTWIDGLETISGKDLANPNHAFYKKNTYDIQGYIEKYGKRKCEANAVVVVPQLGRQILVDAIEKYVGVDAWDNYRAEIAEKQEEVRELILEKLGEEEE